MEAIFECKSLFNCSVETLFGFHEQKMGFDTLVGADRSVEVISAPGSLEVGQQAYLKVAILPFLKIDWLAEHSKYEKNRLFQDIQKKGPFLKFEHSHQFETHPEGSVLIDHIKFDFWFLFFAKYAIALKLKQQFKTRHRLTAEALKINYNLLSCGLV